jgi:hypothetical protein
MKVLILSSLLLGLTMFSITPTIQDTASNTTEICVLPEPIVVEEPVCIQMCVVVPWDECASPCDPLVIEWLENNR